MRVVCHPELLQENSDYILSERGMRGEVRDHCTVQCTLLTWVVVRLVIWSAFSVPGGR